MGMIELICNSCGSSLNMDVSRLMAVCPYCGKKMTYDSDTVTKIMQTSIVESQKTKRMQSVEFTRRERIKGDVERSKQRIETVQLFFFVVLLIACLMYLAHIN